MTRQFVWAAFAVLFTPAMLWAQSRGYDPPRTPEEAQERLRRSEGFLAEMDTNHNGVIEANEATGRAQYFMERMLQRAGMENTPYPIPIQRLREGMARYYASSVQAAPPGSPPGPPPPFGPGGPGGPPPGMPGPPAAAKPPANTPAPLVPGFGIAAAPATTLAATGFGPTAAAKGGSSPSAPGGPSASSEDEKKYREYAANLMSKYDKNRNGTLDRDEWGEMSNNPAAADRNGDGKVTSEELLAWLLDMAKKGSSDSSGRGHGSGKRGSGDSSPAKKPVYRLHTAAERLPAGLPDWFAKKDTDTDGQVSMAEYSQDWNDSRIAEFEKYDLNRDGIITPDECLRSLKASKDPKSDKKPDAKADSKPPATAAVKTDPKSDTKPEAKPDAGLASKMDAKPEAKPGPVPSSGPGPRPGTGWGPRPDFRSDPRNSRGR